MGPGPMAERTRLREVSKHHFKEVLSNVLSGDERS